MSYPLSYPSEGAGQRDIRDIKAWVDDNRGADFSVGALSHLLVTEAAVRGDIRALKPWILGHLYADLSIEALAERVAMVPRNFARLFVKEIGMTPAKFVEQARLEAARCKLEQTALPIETIAEHCGYGDPERMRRSFRRALRVSPQDYRLRFRSTVIN
jgi:transcriptional regulator GlxA family with amidase domain